MNREELLVRKKSVKAKLMAAVSMLLISTLLLGSTSYAWFTLSTAPEVADVTTTAGANGALEIALQSTNAEGNGRADILSTVGQSIAKVDASVSNTYWGNIVDLTTGYGLENVTLYPARLNVNATTIDGVSSYNVVTNSILAAPKYGSDGRVATLANAIKTHYDAADSSFSDSINWGVNVIGFANDLGDVENRTIILTYPRANVLAEATEKVATYREELRDEMEDLIGRNSLGIFGVMLYLAGMNLISDEQLTATVKDYVASMDSIIADSADSVRWALLANAAADPNYSSDSEEDMIALGNIYKGFLQLPITSDDASVESVQSIAQANGYEEVASAAAAVATAEARINKAKIEVADGNIGDAALMLVKPTEASMYGANAPDIAGGSGVPGGILQALNYDLNNARTSDTIFMYATVGANPLDVNLFSSVATVLGDYAADMTVWISADATTMVDTEPEDSEYWLKCVYTIKATNKNSYADWRDVDDLSTVTDEDANIGTLGAVYNQIVSIEAEGDVLMTINRNDVTAYGYSIDLAFQSSEKTSLLLQQEGVNRVSSDDTNASQGSGSTVTFTIPGDLTKNQAESLLQCIHIVFMNTTTGAIYKIAAVDPNTINVVLDTATATLSLYEPVFAEDNSLSLGDVVTDNVITQMDKDTPYYITAVVYLNGDLANSGMFSATQGLSLNGAINLQFSSSATLTPIEYSFPVEDASGT